MQTFEMMMMIDCNVLGSGIDGFGSPCTIAGQTNSIYKADEIPPSCSMILPCTAKQGALGAMVGCGNLAAT
jgi:hypothetical protein